MSEIVGIFATSHVPAMVNLSGAAPAAQREAVFAGFQAIGREIEARGADTIVLISDDHLHNFFLDNLPAFCIGAADSYPTPIEGWLKTAKYTLDGDAALGAHILFEVMHSGFDPALSMQLTLDHGTVVPLELAGIAGHQRIVPVHVNTVQPPMPSYSRCIAIGRAIAKAISSFEDDRRVAIFASGGISHDVGTPRMGMVNEGFDRAFLDLLAQGKEEPLVRYIEQNINTAGNGAEEIRNWLVAHGIAGERGYRTRLYEPIPEWYTGVAQGEWAL